MKLKETGKLHDNVFNFLYANYDTDIVLSCFADIDVPSYDSEDETGSNGFWDATNNLIQAKYNIQFVNDNDKAVDEQQNLYDVLNAMREYYCTRITL